MLEIARAIILLRSTVAPQSLKQRIFPLKRKIRPKHSTYRKEISKFNAHTLRWPKFTQKSRALQSLRQIGSGSGDAGCHPNTHHPNPHQPNLLNSIPPHPKPQLQASLFLDEGLFGAEPWQSLSHTHLAQPTLLPMGAPILSLHTGRGRARSHLLPASIPRLSD